MALLMLVPFALAGVLAVARARRGISPEPLAVRGTVLVLVGFLAEVTRLRLLDERTATELGRLFGGLDLSLALAVLWLNRPGVVGPQAGRCVRLVAAGVAANALPVLLVGAMPFWGAGARLAGVPAAEVATPAVGYVEISGVPPAVVPLGDLLPLPGLWKVLSLGDLLMFAGIVGLLALALASVAPLRPSSREGDPWNLEPDASTS